MFAKCIKHEFRAMRRTLLPLYLVMPAISLLLGLLMILDGRVFTDNGNMGMDVFGVLMMLFLSFALFGVMIAISVVSFILIIRRFHTSFFTDEGYLSFTLPVTMDVHILSKLTVAVLWSALAVVDAIVCGALIGVGGWIGYDLAAGVQEEIQLIREFFVLVNDMITLNIGTGGMAISIVLGVLNLIVEVFMTVLVLYFAITVASLLAKKNRFLTGVVVYWATGVVFSIPTTAVEILFERIPMNPSTIGILYSAVTLLLNLIYTVACYIGIKWLMEKKLNLA